MGRLSVGEVSSGVSSFRRTQPRNSEFSVQHEESDEEGEQEGFAIAEYESGVQEGPFVQSDDD